MLQPPQDFNVQQNFNVQGKNSNIDDMFNIIMDKMEKMSEQLKKRLEITEIKAQNHDDV